MKLRRIRYVALFATLLVTACTQEGPLNPPKAPIPARIESVGGNGQSGTVGQVLGDPLMVRVVDFNGNPIKNVTVHWSTEETAGEVSQDSLKTADDGIAQVSWALGTSAGEMRATARTGNLPAVSFAATARADRATRLTVELFDTIFTEEKLTARVKAEDQFGNPTTTGAVTWRSANNSLLSVSPSGDSAQIVAGSRAADAQITVEASGITSTKQVAIVEARFSQIAAGEDHTCAIAQRGQVFCWGSNERNRLGNPAIEGRTSVPRKLASHEQFADVQAGADHTCGLTRSGEIHCWGASSFVKRGFFGPSRPLPNTLEQKGPFTKMDIGPTGGCAIHENRRVYCWGTWEDRDGKMYQSTGEWRDELTVMNFAEFSIGYFVACGIDAEGKAYCWGRNSLGQAGTGDTIYAGAPKPVKTDLRFKDIEADHIRACGLATNNQVYCWGWNEYFHLGVETSERCLFTEDEMQPCSTKPVAVDRAPSAVAVVVSPDMHACQLNSDGGISCWGHALYGQNGVGHFERTNHVVPYARPVAGGIQFSQISASRLTTCGLGLNGEAYCWGLNRFGQLGNDQGSSECDFGLGEVCVPYPTRVSKPKP